MPGNFTVGGFGHVEALRDVAERRQHLRRVVGQVAQLTLVHRVADPRRARGGRAGYRYWSKRIRRVEFGAKRLVQIDRHSFFPAMCSAARYPNVIAGPIVPPGPGYVWPITGALTLPAV